MYPSTPNHFVFCSSYHFFFCSWALASFLKGKLAVRLSAPVFLLRWPASVPKRLYIEKDEQGLVLA